MQRPPQNQSASPSPETCAWDPGQVLEHIDIGVLVLDTEQEKVCYCNGAASQILRKARLPRGFHALSRFLAPLFAKGPEAPSQQAAHTFHYHSHILEISLQKTSPTHRCLFLQDNTTRARLESVAQAVNTMDNIGYIFSGIRHEIGNPLNSIKVTMSVLRNNLESFSKETIREYVDRSLGEVSRMEYLLKSLKNFSMYENMEIKEVDLGLFLKRFVSLVRRDFEQRGIKLTVKSPSACKPVKSDERALHQVLLNLLANSADALQGQRHPEIELGVHSRCDDGLAWLSVKDNGRGMTAEEQEHLFQPFCTNKPHGNGLGLVITRKLLANMDSNIEIHSCEDIGTTVKITLPTCGNDQSSVSSNLNP